MLSPSGAPLHVVPPVEGHGVTRFATQVARAVGAPVADLGPVMEGRHGPRRRIHVHVTDALFGPRCEDAARRLVELGAHHDMSVTLHDVPQPGDGAPFERRARAYGAVLDAAVGWAVSSEHERALIVAHVRPRRAGAVVHLPVVALPAGPESAAEFAAEPGPPVIGVLGWVYPVKGHAEVVAACASLGRPVVVRALGSLARGHEGLGERLRVEAESAGVRFEIGGWVAEAGLPGMLRSVAVPVAAHRAVSASASLNTWLAAGRRPVVVDNPYAAEVADLRPGSLWRVEPDGLAEALAEAIDDPARTWLDDHVDLRPDLADAGAAYLAWWATLS